MRSRQWWPIVLAALVALSVACSGSNPAPQSSPSPTPPASVSRAGLGSAPDPNNGVDPCLVLPIPSVQATGWRHVHFVGSEPVAKEDFRRRSCKYAADGGNGLSISTWVDPGPAFAKYRVLHTTYSTNPYMSHVVTVAGSDLVSPFVWGPPAGLSGIVFRANGTVVNIFSTYTPLTSQVLIDLANAGACHLNGACRE